MAKRFFLTVFLLIPLLCFSLETVPDNNDKEWNVLVADLICLDKDEGGEFYIGKTLSAAILKHLSVLKTHKMTENETVAMKEFLRDKYIAEQRQTLAGYYDSYDKLLFEHGDLADRKNLEASIAREERNIRKLEKYRADKIHIKDERNIIFLNYEEGIDTVVKGMADLESRAASSGAEYILWGTVRVVENVVIADLQVYSRLFKKNIVSMRIADDLDNVYDHLGDKLHGLYDTFLGTGWSMVNVGLNDQNGDIFVDGKYAGTGDTSELILSPGEHEIMVTGVNLDVEKKTLNLSEGQVMGVDFKVSEAKKKPFAVSSFPEGADVYYNSIWQGKTPLIINGDSGEVVVSMNGYQDFRTFLEAVEGNSINVFPQKDLFDRDQLLLKKRNAFYRNLTYFVLSIPIPFFTYAMYLSYDDKYDKARSHGINEHEIRKDKRMRNYCRYGYYGSLFLSVTLFANSMFYLHDYIKAGEGTNLRQERKK